MDLMIELSLLEKKNCFSKLAKREQSRKGLIIGVEAVELKLRL